MNQYKELKEKQQKRVDSFPMKFAFSDEHFIKDMFFYELENHEFGYTKELDDTLETLDLTKNEILKNERLKKGLLLTINEVKEVEW